MADIEEIKKNGILSSNDDIRFHRSVDVLNSLFNCAYGAWQRGIWKSPDYYKVVWFPKLTYVRSIEIKNYFEDNSKNILLEEKIKGQHIYDQFWHNPDLERAVFAKDNNYYKFYGIYNFAGLRNDSKIEVKKRSSNELNIKEWSR